MAMTTHDFRAADWVKRLTRSLASLAAVEETHNAELSADPTESRGMRLPSAFNSPSSRRSSLYHRAYSFEDSFYYGPYYRELRSALDAVKARLREHPVLNCALGPSDDNDEFRIYIANTGGLTSLTRTIAGLMSCAMESDFDEVASKLQRLLSAGEEEPLTGYCISVFRGLRLENEMELADGMFIAPFDRISKLVTTADLETIVGDMDRFTQTGPLGVVLKPFQWKPVIVAAGEEADREKLWDKGFPNDTCLIVDLLAIAHGVPALNLMSLQPSVDRWVWDLLGNFVGGISAAWQSGLPVNDYLRPTPISADRFADVKDLFCRLKDTNNDRARHESVVSRLARALLRRGKLGAEDKILDVAIALELMYGFDGPELGYKLGTRASFFLENSAQERVETFGKVKQFYKARSAVVHYDRKKERWEKTPDEYYRYLSEEFNEGFDLARRTLFKLLHEGGPQDWNELVLSEGSQ